MTIGGWIVFALLALFIGAMASIAFLAQTPDLARH